MAKILVKRGTRSAINTAAAASQLTAGEPYLITDENRLAVGLSTTTYQDFAKKSELPSAAPIALSGTVNDVVSTASETALASVTVPAGALGTNGAVDLEIVGDYLNNSGATRTITLKIILGSTTVYQDVTIAQTATANRHPFYCKIRIAAANSTSAQVLGGFMGLGISGGTTSGLGEIGALVTTATGFNMVPLGGSAAEDSTTALALKLDVTHPASNASLSFRALHVYCNTLGGIGAKGDVGGTGASGAGTGNVPPTTPNTTTSYTPVSGDIDHHRYLTNAAAITLTIDNSVFATGNFAMFRQGGAGAVTVVAGSGVTEIRHSGSTTSGSGGTCTTRKKESGITVYCLDATSGIYCVDGDIV